MSTTADPVIYDIKFEEFEERVIKPSQHQAVLVDFWADWCGPCRFLDPVLKGVVKEYDGAVLLAKLEVDEGKNMKLAGQYQVRGFPTIIMFEEGKEVERFSSARPAEFIREFIEMNSRLLEL